jgi:RimJ/RimL family protein N-acetyltransferase
MSSPSTRPPLPKVTIEATARSFYKQAVDYGFALSDFVRFTNDLLGIAMAPSEDPPPSSSMMPGAAKRRYDALPLEGRRVLVRRFGEPGDREVLEGWVHEEEGRFFLLSTASGRNCEVDDLLKGDHNLVGMVMFEGRPVGSVAYLDFNPGQRRAELRKVIGEVELRGRGLGREASKLWLGYGIGALGLRKIYLNTLATHIRNIRINEEIGFRVEGILRNEVIVDGTHRDVLRMGLWHEG